LANIYLSVLDRHFVRIWQREMSPVWRRQYRRRTGRPNYRLVRYADDFVVLVHGTRSEAEALKAEIARLLAEELKMTPLGREDPHHPHRHRLRLPRPPRPGQDPRRHPPCRAHHPGQASVGRR
jgi:RNA-directed DNA polymerase